jgi:FAD/FMN-containing dehydrogenase
MDLEQAVAKVVGSSNVLSDPDVKSSYERDWTGRYGGRARLVVRPQNTAEVAGVMAACARLGAAVVPQGGNTGLVGASVPRAGEVVLSVQGLSEIGKVDTAVGQVTVGAGATLAALQAAARKAGEDAGLDFAARDSCTIGGVVACDAGGARALRHGTARAHVAGLEAVLADGSIVSRLAGLTKDNAGYDLPMLLVGSEGTLGIITRVRWKLAPLLGARVAALVPLGSARDRASRGSAGATPSAHLNGYVIERLGSLASSALGALSAAEWASAGVLAAGPVKATLLLHAGDNERGLRGFEMGVATSRDLGELRGLIVAGVRSSKTRPSRPPSWIASATTPARSPSTATATACAATAPPSTPPDPPSPAAPPGESG